MPHPSEIILCWYAAQETFIFIIVETVLLNQFLLFFQYLLNKMERTVFIWNITFVFTVNLDKSSPSVLNTSISLFQKILLTTNFWTVYVKRNKQYWHQNFVWEDFYYFPVVTTGNIHKKNRAKKICNSTENKIWDIKWLRTYLHNL